MPSEYNETYDLNFAINVRYILLYDRTKREKEGSELGEYLMESVWKPTQAFLEDFALKKPSQIVCFFSKPFNFPRKTGCKCRNLFVVNHRNVAAYLGTVFNKQAVDEYRARLIDDHPEIGYHALTKMSRDSRYYMIPSEVEDIDELAIIKAIQQCFLAYRNSSIPVLAEALICLLSEDQGARLNKAIQQGAKLQAESS